MPQAEHILEKVALNEVSALPWRWIRRDEEEWRAVFQIPDDDGMEHEGLMAFLRTAQWITPKTELTPELVKEIGTGHEIPKRLLTKTSSGQVGPKGLSLYRVDFVVDNHYSKNPLDLDLSFDKVALRIFATVAAVMRDFVKEIYPDALAWTATTASRGAIYKRMMKREKVPGYVGWSGTKRGGYLRLDSPLAR